MPDEPTETKPKIKLPAFLTKKVGPLPVWGDALIAVVVIGGYIWYRKRQAGASVAGAPIPAGGIAGSTSPTGGGSTGSDGSGSGPSTVTNNYYVSPGSGTPNAPAPVATPPPTTTNNTPTPTTSVTPPPAPTTGPGVPPPAPSVPQVLPNGTVSTGGTSPHILPVGTPVPPSGGYTAADFVGKTPGEVAHLLGEPVSMVTSGSFAGLKLGEPGANNPTSTFQPA